MPDTAQGWVGHFALELHPEGGYYRETYRSEESVPAFEFEGFELADCDALVEIFPRHRGVIERLTR